MVSIVTLSFFPSFASIGDEIFPLVTMFLSSGNGKNILNMRMLTVVLVIRFILVPGKVR